MILVVDPGLATAGACTLTERGDLVDADAFTSKPSKKPKGTTGAWAATDRTRRVFELGAWLDEHAWGRTYSVAVLEALGSAQSAAAAMQMAAAAGGVAMWVRDREIGEICQPTSVEWRQALGHYPTAIAKGTTKAERARIKKADDERLYAMLRSLPGGDQVEQHVLHHGRNASAVVHALDAFGIGQWFLRRRDHARTARQSTHARAA